MKNKKNPEVVISAVVCFGLMLIILSVYYRAVFGEHPAEKKREFSVVLYHAGADGWESLIEGMKQAEADFTVKMHYITAKENMPEEEQLELIRQEIANGTDGILLAAADSKMALMDLQTEGTQIPVITVESDVDNANWEYIAADNKKMGQMLAQALLQDFAEEKKMRVVVIEEYMNRSSVRERYQGFCETMGDSAEILVVKRENNNTDLAVCIENSLNHITADAVVAFSKEPLEILCEMPVELLEQVKLYGIGNTASIVAALDKGKIEKLVFQNEFNIGYLSVEAILNKTKGIEKEREEIDIYCIGKENVHETQYERLLFPIVE